MNSPARLAANAQNAQHSTGPRTQEGKDRVRHNATRHGFTSKTLIAKGESQEEHDALKTGFLRDYAPANDVERALVERVAENHWRLQRLYRAEAQFIDAMQNEVCGNLGAMFADASTTARTSLFLRYLNTAERAYNRSLADLKAAQADRAQVEAEQAPKPVSFTEATWLEMMEQTPDGFVSQTAADASMESAATHGKGVPPADSSANTAGTGAAAQQPGQ